MSALPFLSDATLREPRYDRAAVRSGVVHLGLGAFHRAHQAPVFDALIAGGDARWGITGVAMRSPDVVEALARQDGLYSLSQRAPDMPAPHVIGAIRKCHIAAQEPDAVVAALAHTDTHLATLTVTEKGYLDHGPASAAGLLARALERRRLAGLAPLTILSCDNRAHNGTIARAAVLAAAQAGGIDDAGLRWIDEQTAFPSAMVDRITPAATEAMIAESSAALRLQDDAAIWTEPFWQWVVEDRFAAARPDLARAGVQVVADVAPWEDAKLRLLNGAHSTLAYLGLLRGHAYVHAAMGDADLARLVAALWRESGATLDRDVVDVSAYTGALKQRFANTALPHALIQIAADGSQKLPPRLLAPLRERAARGLASPALACAVAGWMLALAQVEGLVDPLLEPLVMVARTHQPARDTVAALFGVLGTDPAPAANTITDIAAALDHLRAGAGGSLTSALVI